MLWVLSWYNDLASKKLTSNFKTDLHICYTNTHRLAFGAMRRKLTKTVLYSILTNISPMYLAALSPTYISFQNVGRTLSQA